MCANERVHTRRGELLCDAALAGGGVVLELEAPVRHCDEYVDASLSLGRAPVDGQRVRFGPHHASRQGAVLPCRPAGEAQAVPANAARQDRGAHGFADHAHTEVAQQVGGRAKGGGAVVAGVVVGDA